MNENSIAFDVGYGYTKVVTGHDEQTGLYSGISFPSQSVYTFKMNQMESDLDKNDVVSVQLGDRHYVVGPDIALYQKSNFSRVLTSEYVHSNQYKVLNLAALAYTGKTHIEFLMVGLPVNLLDTKKDFLIQMLQGEHKFNNEKTITVKNVIPVAQPLGGLIYARQTHAIEYQSEHHYLVIDPGYFTLDWFVMEGSKRNKEKSGHFPNGMSHLYQAIAKAISHDFEMDFRDIDSIDKGLQGKPFYIKNKTVNLKKYLQQALPYMDDAVQSMLNAIGQSQMYDAIILVGGGATIFKQLLKTYLPTKLIVNLENTAQANVRGFYHLGEQIINQQMEKKYA